MITTVVNARKDQFDVYIGRRSKWGNPFTMKTMTRDEAVERYRAWIQRQSHLLADLHELQGKRLGCFCKPKLCHGDILAELANALGRDGISPAI